MSRVVVICLLGVVCAVGCGGESGVADADAVEAVALDIPDGCHGSYVGECPFDPYHECPCLCPGKTHTIYCGYEFFCGGERGGWVMVDQLGCTTYEPATRLNWQTRLPTSAMTWPEAQDYCELNPDNLGGSGWRLPTIDELRTLVGECPASRPGGTCGVTEACPGHASCSAGCTPCAENEFCFRDAWWVYQTSTAPRCAEFWSATLDPDAPGDAWMLDFSTAAVTHAPATEEHWVMCVSGPP